MPQNNLEKGKILPLQLAMLVIGFCIGDSIIISPGRTVGHDTWIAYVISLAGITLLAVAYTILALRFKGKTLVEINAIVYGVYVGKLVSALFLWFFFHIGSLVLGIFSQFFTVTTYDQTPGVVFIIFTVIISAFAIQNGIEVIVRCSQILVPIMLGIIIFNTLLLVPNMDLRNLLPVMEKPIGEILLAAQEIVALPFAETVVFLMIFPFLTHTKKLAKSYIAALILTWLALFVLVIRNVAVLGPSAEIYTYPIFQSLRLINIFHLLTRMEIFTSIIFLTMGFLKITTVFYGTVLGAAQLLGLKSYRVLITPVGILMIILALNNFSNISESIGGTKVFWAIYTFPFEIGIPLLTLIIALFRKLPKEES